MKQHKFGFKLIELIIIIAIIALLATITFPTYQKNTTQARLASVIAKMEHLNLELLHSYYATGKPPANLAGVSGAGSGGYTTYAGDNIIKTLHYQNGSGWVNKGAVLQVSVPSSIGDGIPGYIESTDGTDGAYNSIAMAFYDNGGTLMLFCGRWDSTSTLYIPVEFLPSGCDSDNFKDLVTKNKHQ
jgi:type II secretory pathway pseudopilin PulG